MKTLNFTTFNFTALAAAVFATAVTLVALHSQVRMVPVSEINGTRVVDLAPVTVTATAAEMRAAALDDSSAAVAGVAVDLAGRHEVAAGLLGRQLAMPYYSFGNKLGRISKE